MKKKAGRKARTAALHWERLRNAIERLTPPKMQPRGALRRWIERSALDGKSAGEAGIIKHRATERAIHLGTASLMIAA
jgi:hypothetical protein